jgi:hypothetical protein
VSGSDDGKGARGRIVRIPLGQVVATPGALEQVPAVELFTALRRHAQGDWGDVNDTDRSANDRAVQRGERILSAYSTANGLRFWVITEADRSATTILLPSEY